MVPVSKKDFTRLDSHMDASMQREILEGQLGGGRDQLEGSNILKSFPGIWKNALPSVGLGILLRLLSAE